MHCQWQTPFKYSLASKLNLVTLLRLQQNDSN
jgi:hypothetical protein